jgi:predicted N-acetyltransferase YhbS
MEGSNLNIKSRADAHEKAQMTAISPSERDWPEVIRFLEANLRPGQAWSIVDEYPTSLSKANRHNMRVIAEEGRILSHAVFRPMIIKTPIGVFKAAGIGSVVTAPNERGRGLSTTIIESCLEGAASADCDIAILWTDLFDFYRRMDFELAGSEVSILLEQRNFAASAHLKAGFTFLDSNKIAPEAILRLYQSHTVNSHRSQEDVRFGLAIPNSHVATAWDAQGKMAAYAVIGKGADLDGYIHEWGGSVSALMALFQYLIESKKRDLRVIAPAHSTGLLAKLREFDCQEHRGYLGMIRILKTDSLFSKIKRHARSIGVSDLVLEEDTGTYKFGYQNQTYRTDSKRDLVQLLFGPEKPSQLGKIDPATAKILDRVLPIPLWVWGWDSV